MGSQSSRKYNKANKNNLKYRVIDIYSGTISKLGTEKDTSLKSQSAISEKTKENTNNIINTVADNIKGNGGKVPFKFKWKEGADTVKITGSF